ncbi:hypothetical protein NITHO_1020011 [Nitrolancea hollandica Lb]|uniref:Uncharacterized protein n=1 Tax=Nitrolancea hollandica Lb TaxID=1129897 RepID=I4ECB9_9BACT|nr:hypothetical protein NITHO_1020011 [Nitrolancea hollandica Lb]
MGAENLDGRREEMSPMLIEARTQDIPFEISLRERRPCRRLFPVAAELELLQRILFETHHSPSGRCRVRASGVDVPIPRV